MTNRVYMNKRLDDKNFISSLGSMLKIDTPRKSTYKISESVQDSLRNDMIALGNDLRIAIEKEQKREKAAS